MQAAPYRLSQTIWAVFRATRPATPTSLTQHLQCSRYVQSYARTRPTLPSQIRIPGRCYSQSTKSSDVEQKIVDAKERIHSSLDARAETAADAQSPLRQREDETIVHANPESSSIVHLRNRIPKSDPNVREQPERHAQLPSEKADVRSQITTKFSHFMDDLQSKIFVASQRLNDLTGYTGIERLKREIDQQESAVQAARQAVKDSRTAYSEAIAMRSATQREVNDLLQRKHAWSPQDLERFTNLYRSDHANEQAEQQSHQRLSDAEVRYEEASTKLAKSILARYHEEQIWSDKIRQMSTWGTWGLMGLNILLFIVLQLAIEPWRRRRLVRGFEEKVQVALASREKENQELRAQLSQRSGSGGAVVAAATERLAESVVDAITGSTGDIDHTSIGSVVPADRQTIEAAAEQITTGEINDLNVTASKVARISETVKEGGSPDVPILESIPQSSIWSRVPSSIYTNIATTCYGAYSTVVRQFDTTSYTVMSQRQVTANFVEGLAAGVALAGGVMLVLARNR